MSFSVANTMLEVPCCCCSVASVAIERKKIPGKSGIMLLNGRDMMDKRESVQIRWNSQFSGFFFPTFDELKSISRIASVEHGFVLGSMQQLLSGFQCN